MSDPSTESRSFPWMYVILGAVLLLPSLAFPIYTDHATFLRGGAAIFDGELLYVDFIDVKPPLAFVVFGIFEFFIGSSEVGMRVLDLLWQTSTIAVMMMVLRRYSVSQHAQLAFTVLYAMSYVTLHWAQSLQMETLAGLPTAVVLLMLSKPRALWRNVVIGFCLAMIVLMKYTLGIVAVMIVAHMLISPATTREKISQITQWTVFSILWVFVFLAPFVFRDGFLDGWKTVSAYTANYASNPAWSMDLVRAALKKTAVLFGDNLSLFMCIAAAMGAVRAMASKRTDLTSFVSLIVFIGVGLLATVVLERKFAPYHFSRIYLPMSVLAGIGVAYGIVKFKEHRSNLATPSRAALMMIAAATLVFSPLPRYLGATRLAAASIVDPLAIERYMQNRVEGPLNYASIRSIQDAIGERTSNDDKVMLMSVTANMISADLDHAHYSHFADSHIYFATGAPESWKLIALEEMKGADWLMLDTDDRHELMTIHNRTSYESVMADERFADVLYSTFVLDTTIDTYNLYQRISASTK